MSLLRAWPSSSPPCSSWLRAAALAPGRLGLEFFEQRVEALVVLFEDRAVAFDPVHGLLQSLGCQPAWTPLRIDIHQDEAGALQHFQVLGDGGLAHLERLRSEEHTSELQSRENLVCRLLLEK